MKYHFTEDVRSFIRDLLHKDPSRRLVSGCSLTIPANASSSSSSSSSSSTASTSSVSAAATARFRQHVFFCGDGGGPSFWEWDDLEAGRLRPPFMPPMGRSREDTRNFDTEFTRLPVEQPLGDERRYEDVRVDTHVIFIPFLSPHILNKFLLFPWEIMVSVGLSNYLAVFSLFLSLCQS